ncbi:MAG: hypothetical protein ACOCWG_03560 [bacterium]
MNKIKLLKYDPPYGGQSFKKRGIRNGYEIFNKFLESLTTPVEDFEMELTIFEEPKNKINSNYSCKKYVESASKIFGKGEYSEWLNNINNPNDKEYYYKWKINKDDFEVCIDFVDRIKPFPKYYIGPIQISISYWFNWKNYILKKQLFVSDYFSKNHLNLFLSKTNTIIPDFIFPFDTINPEFVEIYRSIINFLPIDLSIKKFRHYLPTKNEKDYIVRKLTSQEILEFEKMFS